MILINIEIQNAPSENSNAAAIPSSEIYPRKKLLTPKHTPATKLGMIKNFKFKTSSIYVIGFVVISVLNIMGVGKSNNYFGS
jgi:hypothetical protein